MANKYLEHRAKVANARIKMFLIILPFVLLFMFLIWLADRRNPSARTSSDSVAKPFSPSKIQSMMNPDNEADSSN